MKKKVLELLKSGNFTILYHDSGCASLYPGHIKYGQSGENSKNYVPSIDEFDDLYDVGYAPSIVIALAKALGGKVDSI